jgi:hypothetical protein
MKKIKKTKNQKFKKISTRKLFFSVIAIFLGLGISLNIMLSWKVKPVLQELNDINLLGSAFMISLAPSKNQNQTENNIKSKSNKKTDIHHKDSDINHHKKYKIHKIHRSQDEIKLPSPVWENQ